MKKWISFLLTLCMLGALAYPVLAAPDDFSWVTVCAVSAAGDGEYKAEMQTIGGVNYLFLPSHVSLAEVSLQFTLTQEASVYSVRGARKAVALTQGEAFDLLSLCGEGQEYPITLTAKKGISQAVLNLTIVPTAAIASMFLKSDDPIGHGREWVEASPDKSNKAAGSMLLVDKDGGLVYDNTLTQIKGRGNSTWAMEKKPYQIKLSEKADLLQTGRDENRSKTWVLLANAADSTLLRNEIVYDLSVAMQMQPGIECRPINLYYDGEYRGAYLLCEKVEVGKGRVDITDLEGANEEANPDQELAELAVKRGKTENGATYVYCDHMSSPEDISGGYLLEMEEAVRAQDEACYFYTTRGNYVVVKSPEYCSAAEMDYIASYYQEFEDTVFNRGVNPSNGKSISDYAAMESIAQCYIVNELTKNPDGYHTSQYLYKEAGDPVMTMGPVWDYDLSFGRGWDAFSEACADPEGFFTLRSDFGEALYQIPAFRRSVHDIYTETVAPLIKETLLGGNSENAALRSFQDYCAALSAPAYANGKLWYSGSFTWERDVAAVKSYIATRSAWLNEAFSTWNAEDFEPLTGFIDVFEGAWYYEDVNAAAQYGLVNGLGNRIFAPEDTTTRAQAAKVLYEMAGAVDVEPSPVFYDVLSTDWFAFAVQWAQANSIVNGYGDGGFHPEDNITRQDLLVLLYRYLDAPEVSGNKLDAFIDGAAVADYARNAVAWAVENGVLSGYEDNTLRPENNITRAELATIIVRFYEGLVLP